MCKGCGSSQVASDGSGKRYVAFQSGRGGREGEVSEGHVNDVEGGSLAIAGQLPREATIDLEIDFDSIGHDWRRQVPGQPLPADLSQMIQFGFASSSGEAFVEDVEDDAPAIPSTFPQEEAADLEIDFDSIGHNWRRQASSRAELDLFSHDWQRQGTGL